MMTSSSTFPVEDDSISDHDPENFDQIELVNFNRSKEGRSFSKRYRIWFLLFFGVPVIVLLTTYLLYSPKNAQPPNTAPPIDTFSHFGGEGHGSWMRNRQRDNSFSVTNLNKRKSILCKLEAGSYGKTKYCQSRFIAESIDLFYVICPIYSFGKKFDSLLSKRHTNFQHYIDSIGIPFVTFEAIKYASDEEYIMTKPNNEPFEMQGYYYNVSYIRENLLNVAIQRLNVDWEYVAWIDAHQVFENPFWWEEAISKSEQFKMVQLFSDCHRLDNQNKTQRFRSGFFHTSLIQYDMDTRVYQMETGNAHMISRDTYEKIGYIHDECFASGCDWAWVKAGLPAGSLFLLEPAWPRYNHTHQPWLQRVTPIVNGSRAYIRGSILHLDHKSDFSYKNLRTMVEGSSYNLTRDFHRDENGVFYLSNFKLASKVESYYLTNN